VAQQNRSSGPATNPGPMGWTTGGKGLTEPKKKHVREAGRHHDPAEGSLSALCRSTSTSFVEPSGKTMFIEPHAAACCTRDRTATVSCNLRQPRRCGACMSCSAVAVAPKEHARSLTARYSRAQRDAQLADLRAPIPLRSGDRHAATPPALPGRAALLLGARHACELVPLEALR